MRFLHTADWQLGMTRHFLAGEAQPRYSAARRDAVAALGDLAVDQDAEFVVVAGDVFEHPQLAPDVISQSLEAMRRIGRPIFLLPGNHDPAGAGSIYRSSAFQAECPANVTALTAGGSYEVRPGVEVIAAPWMSKRPLEDLAAAAVSALPPPAPGIRVLVAHGAVDTLDPDPANPAVIGVRQLQDALAAGRIHYVALGDRHSLTRVDDRIWYSGSPEPTNFDDVEPDPGHVLVVDIDEDDPAHPATVTPVKVGRWQFHTVRGHVDTAADITDLAARLERFTAKDRTVIRTALAGTLSITDRAALDETLERASRLFAWIGPWRRHTDLAVAPRPAEFADLGLGGYFTAAVDELVNAATTPEADTAADAQAALALLLRLTRGGAA